MLVLVLDDFHLGDPMFSGRLARAAAKRTIPLVVVHDSGEGGGRALEALGHIVERDENGVWPVRTNEERRIVERAARDLNRKLVAELNENGVPAVRITGLDRGLLSMNHEGTLRCGGGEWIQSLAEQGTVPVIAGLVETADGTAIEVSAGRVGAVISASNGQIGFLKGNLDEEVEKMSMKTQSEKTKALMGTISELLTGVAK